LHTIWSRLLSELAWAGADWVAACHPVCGWTAFANANAGVRMAADTANMLRKRISGSFSFAKRRKMTQAIAQDNRQRERISCLI
jgi:hypothetical protein